MKKLLSILMCMMVIVTVMPMSVYADELLTEIDIVSEPVLSASPQEDELDTVIDTDSFMAFFKEQIKSYPEEIDVSAFKIPAEGNYHNLVTSLIYYETPELFNIVGLTLKRYASDKIIRTIKPSYRYSMEQYNSDLARMKAAGEVLLKGVKGNNNLTDVEKALILHDRLAVWTEYYVDYASATTDEEKIIYTACGVLANKTGVCQGYTLAYDYLLEQIGIDSYLCRSDDLNHAWNIVIIDDTPYHVDVTWDDPVYDKTGRVNHTNFLRSTNGLIETGHIKDGSTTIDYNSEPVDTTYDNYYWQNSTTAFQLIDNQIYYLDNSEASIKKLTSTGTQTIVTGLTTKWHVSGNSGSYYPGCYSNLSSDGTDLYYSNSQKIHKYNISTGTTSVAWDLSSNQYKIYGFKWENCKFICDMNSSPNFSKTTKVDNGIQQTHHAKATGDWIIESFASGNAVGTSYRPCPGCNEKQANITSTTVDIIDVAGENVLDGNNSILYTTQKLLTQSNMLVTTNIETALPTIKTDTTQYYGTGSKIHIRTSANEKAVLTVVIEGDLNGDSVCDVLDTHLASVYSNGLKEPTETEIYAANGDTNSSIDDTTYQNLVNIALQ